MTMKVMKVTKDTEIYSENPRAVEGDNSKTSGFAKAQLISTVERIERLEEEKAALGDDIKEVYSEAKGIGFDTKIIRRCLQLRKMDAADREEAEAMIDLYMAALAGVARPS